MDLTLRHRQPGVELHKNILFHIHSTKAVLEHRPGNLTLSAYTGNLTREELQDAR